MDITADEAEVIVGLAEIAFDESLATGATMQLVGKIKVAFLELEIPQHMIRYVPPANRKWDDLLGSADPSTGKYQDPDTLKR